MKLKLLVPCALLLTLAACDKLQQSKETEISVTTDEERFNYGLGMMIGERVLKQYGEVDYDLVLAGMRAQHGDQETLITLEEAGNAINALMEQQFAEQTAANRKRGEEFLKSNAENEGVQVTESGLQYEVLTAGSGATPSASSKVSTHYEGKLIDGRVFDSSYQRGQPADFPVNGVIAGWTEALQMMEEGAKWRLYVPYHLAYGEKGAGGLIGPYATLIFDVELISVLS